jgi:sulfate transport system permease protein
MSGPGATRTSAMADPPWLRRLLIALALAFVGLFLVVPLATVFVGALGAGFDGWLRAVSKPDTLSALWLTLLAAAIAVPLNLVFGLCAAWLLAKFRFRGRELLVTLVDLPFSISPVVAGLMFVLLFGYNGWMGEWLADRDMKIIFAVPGIVLATTFVTLPFVAREVLPLMQTQGNSEEESAMTLGAGSWTVFLRITLPKVKWAVLYGVVLANARAMGEFGAVSVVSGHIRGATNTLPLQAEILYNEYDAVGAFAVASLLTLLALVTLVLRKWVERRSAT